MELVGEPSKPADPARNPAAPGLEALQRRYNRFVGSLPAPLAEAAAREATFRPAHAGGPQSEERLALDALNPVLVATPWLFEPLFQEVGGEPAAVARWLNEGGALNQSDRLTTGRLLDLAEAGLYGVLASVLQDHLLDRQSEAPAEAALLSQALSAAAARGYRQLFPAGNAFWRDFDRLSAEHLAGLAAELRAQRPEATFDQAAFRRLAWGKVAPIVLTVAGVCHAAGQAVLLPLLEASLKAIALASQMLDDLGDWRADLAAGRRTYFLAWLAE
ncbi:MAG: hypothetical protein ACRDHL_05300, partial [Candidatus Promineifilaceae bacterium]